MTRVGFGGRGNMDGGLVASPVRAPMAKDVRSGEPAGAVAAEAAPGWRAVRLDEAPAGHDHQTFGASGSIDRIRARVGAVA